MQKAVSYAYTNTNTNTNTNTITNANVNANKNTNTKQVQQKEARQAMLCRQPRRKLSAVESFEMEHRCYLSNVILLKRYLINNGCNAPVIAAIVHPARSVVMFSE